MRAAAVALLLGAAAALLAGAAAEAAKKKAYVAAGRCDGLPRIDLKTPPGTCLGLVTQDLKFPRGVAALPTGEILVADMGGWVAGRGAVWEFAPGRKGGPFKATRLFSKLDEPHGIALGPDGRVYVGELTRIFRFDPADPKASVEDVIGGASAVAALPGTGRHPLTGFVFDGAGDLYVTVGSVSDNCEGPDEVPPDPAAACPETLGPEARGVVRRYTMAWPEGRVVSWQDFSAGLRNAMALAVHPGSDAVYAVDNGRDYIDAQMPELADDGDLPHEKLVRLAAGANFGWPYCYDDGVASPEYPDADCSRYAAPLRLLPAHAAPLGMAYYAGAPLAEVLGGRLVIAYHGYRDHGHRVVAFAVGPDGAPRGDPIDVISGWEAGVTHPQGAPVAIAVGADGALYVSEDHNGTLLRLAPDR